MPTPTVFLSYSWDSHEHQRWVRELAARLRADGVSTVLDQWHAVPGDQLPLFMETAVRESQYVLVICTPAYKLKSDNRHGGVGYEGDIMTAEAFTKAQRRKFIPVLHSGDWQLAAPSWLLGTYYIDLRGEPYSEASYQDLVDTLHGRREQAPPVGMPPPDGLPRAFYEESPRHFLFAVEKKQRTVWPPNCVFIELPNGDTVAFKSLEYSTLQELLDDLYVYYLNSVFELATYGKSWVLVSRNTARVAVPLSWLLRSTSASLREVDPSWARLAPAYFGIECAISMHPRARELVQSWSFSKDSDREGFIDKYKQVGSFWKVSSVSPNSCFGLATNLDRVIDEFFWGDTHPFKTLGWLLHSYLEIADSKDIAPGKCIYEAVFLNQLFRYNIDDFNLGGKILKDQRREQDRELLVQK
jgi:hypothetical protein